MFSSYKCACPELQNDMDGYVNGERWRLAVFTRIQCGPEGTHFIERSKNWFQKIFSPKKKKIETKAYKNR
jgi:hypothetical protein